MRNSSHASRNTNLTNILATKIGKSVDISNGEFICSSNLVRITAIEQSRIKSSNCQSDTGLLLPQGRTEYFQTTENEIISIEGNVNISSIQ